MCKYLKRNSAEKFLQADLEMKSYKMQCNVNDAIGFLFVCLFVFIGVIQTLTLVKMFSCYWELQHHFTGASQPASNVYP